MTPPWALSATRCCGCQPARAVADFDVSRAERKAWRVNGLAPSPPAQASHDAAAMSPIEGSTRMLTRPALPSRPSPASGGGQGGADCASFAASSGPVLRKILVGLVIPEQRYDEPRGTQSSRR